VPMTGGRRAGPNRSGRFAARPRSPTRPPSTPVRSEGSCRRSARRPLPDPGRRTGSPRADPTRSSGRSRSRRILARAPLAGASGPPSPCSRRDRGGCTRRFRGRCPAGSDRPASPRDCARRRPRSSRCRPRPRNPAEHAGGARVGAAPQRQLQALEDEPLRIRDGVGLVRRGLTGDPEHLLLERPAVIEREKIELAVVSQCHASTAPLGVPSRRPLSLEASVDRRSERVVRQPRPAARCRISTGCTVRTPVACSICQRQVSESQTARSGPVPVIWPNRFAPTAIAISYFSRFRP
jgi:hypothetical protein